MPSPTKGASHKEKEANVAVQIPEDFNEMVDPAIAMVASLPSAVKKRLRALKKLQFEGIQLEGEFYKKIHELECTFAPQFKQLFDEREKIVNGKREPTAEEAVYPLYHDVEGVSEELRSKLQLENGSGDVSKSENESESGEISKGIPNFWLTVFQHADITAEMIQEHDEAVLQHLTNVDVEPKIDPAMGFTLRFEFAPNDYFSNEILTKEYTLKCDYDPSSPFSFDGPEIISCKGCTINWKEGKDVTVKLVKKKQKHKHKGATRFVTRQVKNDSFFNFFDPPKAGSQLQASGDMASAVEEVDEQTAELLEADYEIGQALRDRVIPRAVLYFTGEAVDDDDFLDESDAEDEDDDDDVDDDDDLH